MPWVIYAHDFLHTLSLRRNACFHGNRKVSVRADTVIVPLLSAMDELKLMS